MPRAAEMGRRGWRNARILSVGEPFLYFRSGRIYAVAHSDLTGHKYATGLGREVEHFWLCLLVAVRTHLRSVSSNRTVRLVLYPKVSGSSQELREEDARGCTAA